MMRPKLYLIKTPLPYQIETYFRDMRFHDFTIIDVSDYNAEYVMNSPDTVHCVVLTSNEVETELEEALSIFISIGASEIVVYTNLEGAE